MLRFLQWDVRYFPAGRLIRSAESDIKMDESNDRLFADHPRLRRFVIRLRPDWPLMCFYFHWSDGSDLSALDERVAAGVVDDADLPVPQWGRASRWGTWRVAHRCRW
jgi:hypothetical protein